MEEKCIPQTLHRKQCIGAHLVVHIFEVATAIKRRFSQTAHFSDTP